MLVHPRIRSDRVSAWVPSRSAGTGSCIWSAFVLFVVLGKYRARQESADRLAPQDVDDMLLYGVFGVILGGRLGYVLFYKPLYYLAHPLEIFSVWQGGMSFHGGFLGRPRGAVVLRAGAPEALARCHRFRRTPRAAGPCRRPPRQFHQRRAVGTRDRRAMGDGVSAGRSRAAPSVPALSIRLSRACCCSPCCGSTRSAGARSAPPRGCSCGLRAVPVRRRVRARARQLSRVSRARPHDGPVALVADDRHRRGDAAPCVSPRRQGGADACSTA